LKSNTDRIPELFVSTGAGVVVEVDDDAPPSAALFLNLPGD
jgi:hypothetical protein